MDKKPIALLDMDGTMFDYDKAMMEYLNKIRSPEEPEIKDIRSLEYLPYMSERMRLIKKQPGWWENLEIIPLGKKIYGILKILNFNIHILTKAPTKITAAWTEKAECCSKRLDVDGISITTDKSLTYGKILVDDFQEYAFGWLEYRPRGLVIMPENSQNKDIKHPNILICNESNLNEVYLRCKKIADDFFNNKNQED